jgi:membrane protease YdiL (CAAX protease family)
LTGAPIPPNGIGFGQTPGLILAGGLKLARHAGRRQNGSMAALLRIIARHPVVWFVVIGLGAGFLTAAIRPIADADVLPYGLPLHGVLGGVLGIGVGAFLVNAALEGREGVVDLARRSVRWRVQVRWYLVALFTVPVGATVISLVIYGAHRALASPAGGWPRALAEVAAVFVLQLVLFQLAEEIGFTGFLQHHWQDRYHPMKLSLYVALLWAVWHLPDHFAEEGWGVEALISAPIVFAVEFVSLFFARALFVWFYNVTAFSVLLVAIFHASFDASISQLSRDVVPASNTARFLIFSAVIMLAATIVIIATRGQLGRAKVATAAGFG